MRTRAEAPGNIKLATFQTLHLRRPFIYDFARAHLRAEGHIGKLLFVLSAPGVLPDFEQVLKQLLLLWTIPAF